SASTKASNTIPMVTVLRYRTASLAEDDDPSRDVVVSAETIPEGIPGIVWPEGGEIVVASLRQDVARFLISSPFRGVPSLDDRRTWHRSDPGDPTLGRPRRNTWYLRFSCPQRWRPRRSRSA